MKRLPFLFLLLASAAQPQTDDSGAKIAADRVTREGPMLERPVTFARPPAACC